MNYEDAAHESCGGRSKGEFRAVQRIHRNTAAPAPAPRDACKKQNHAQPGSSARASSDRVTSDLTPEWKIPRIRHTSRPAAKPLPAPPPAMDVATGQPVPAALLQAQLSSGDPAARETALTSLARAHAAGLDVTSVVGAPTPAWHTASPSP